MTTSKKVLEIKKGEYLLEILNNGHSVNTTYNIDHAMDVSSMELEHVGFLVENFKRVGYTKVKIVTVEPKEEVKEEAPKKSPKKKAKKEVDEVAEEIEIDAEV
jgi:hypothetical protein